MTYIRVEMSEGKWFEADPSARRWQWRGDRLRIIGSDGGLIAEFPREKVLAVCWTSVPRLTPSPASS